MELKKNPEADLNKQRGIFFQIGMIISVGLMLFAFTYSSSEGGLADLGQLVIEDPVEMDIPQTEQKVTPPPPPPPPVLEVVADDEIIEEDEVQSTEVNQDTKIDIPVIEPEEGPSEPEIFTIVEEMPTFPGGDQALLAFMGKNTKYPPMARENGLQGIVVVTFVVDEKGNINNVQVLRGIGGGCDEEAIRVVKSMPTWKPGKQRGLPVRVQYNLPFRFTLR